MNTPRKREKKMKGEFRKKPKEEEMKLMIKFLSNISSFLIGFNPPANSP